MYRATGLLACLCLAMVGCDAPTSSLVPDAGEEETFPPLDYYGDIRPLLSEHCLTCHVDGGIAPFQLDSFEAVTEVGERVMEVTRDRIMPPFLADASGECNEFANARHLEQEEIDLIGAWVRQGMPEGNPETPAPPTPDLLALGEVSATLDMGVEYAPSRAVDDDYRCFVVDPSWSGSRFLTGYDVRPGNATAVHHVIVFQPVNRSEADQAVAMAEADQRPGYTCYGDAVVLALPVVLWAPGTGATMFPENTGIRLNGDQPLIIQVHYNTLANDPTPDRTEIDLRLADTVDTEASMALLANLGLSLPPRMAEVETHHEGTILFGPTGPLRVWGAFPHMHTLGRQLRVEAIRDTGNQCMIDVPRWDFNWQSGYFYQTPIDLDAGQLLSLDCTYDTTERDEVTSWGDGTADEMCLSFFYVTPR